MSKTLKFGKNDFVLVPEGTQVLTIEEVKIVPKDRPSNVELIMVHENGGKIKNGFDLNKDVAVGVLGWYYKTAMGISANEEIEIDINDLDNLLDVKLEVEVVHNKVESNKEAGKFLTFPNVKNVLRRVDAPTDVDTSNIASDLD